MDAKQHRIKIRDYGEQQLEALGLPPKLEFELDGGEVIELAHPWLWSDEVQTAYDAVYSGADLDRDKDGNIVRKPAEPQSVRIARAVLGEDAHRRFVAGGGSSNQIILAIELMKQRNSTKTEDGADPKDNSS